MKYNDDHHISIIIYNLQKKDRSYFDSKLAELKHLCKASKESSKKNHQKNVQEMAKKFPHQDRFCNAKWAAS